MFAAKIAKTFDYADGTVTVRKLSALQLEECATARQVAVSRNVKAMGPEILVALREAGSSTPKTPKPETPEEKWTSYDRATVLHLGVTAWSFGPVTRELLDDLDEPAADRIFREVMLLSVSTEEATESARSKG
jgi:hypothetical protein